MGPADLARRIVRRLNPFVRRTALTAGPLSLMPTKHLFDMASSLRRAENALANAGIVWPSSPSTMELRELPTGRRSVAFLGNCYYNFYYLARALRRRGWDAVSVSVEDPKGPNSQFYHGEDVNLFDSDPGRYRQNISEFFSEVERRFAMVHFYGRGHMSFFPAFFDTTMKFDAVPADFFRLRQRGIMIGYSISGCLDGVAQATVRRWTGGACDRCVWQTNPDICNDRGNLGWGHKVYMMCDLIATEGFPALDWQSGAKVYREPLTTALDPDFWRPDLEVPERFRLKRAPGELIVYHGVGNYAIRARDGRDLKGTGAILAAIERLRGEGVPVRLEFVTNVPNKEVRFIQLQADVVIDQLNHGRYGAQAREGLMLGRPTVCFINKEEPPGAARLESIETCPLVSAGENTIYDVLKDLLGNEAKRRIIGEASRAFALKWHSADACAERFEQVYDRLMRGLGPAEARS